MYTPLSWYFIGTEKATPERFLDVVEEWLTSPKRKKEYKFHFSKHLRDQYPERILENGNDSSLEVLTTEDEAYQYVSVCLETESGNAAFIVECVLRRELENERESCFVINYRKKLIDPDQPIKFFDPSAHPPRLPEFLLDQKLASKEKEPEFATYDPLTDQTVRILRSKPMPIYPIVTINVSATDHNYVSAAAAQYLCERYASVFHIVWNEVTDQATADPWAFRIEYPRLQYTMEYYSQAKFPRQSNQEKGKKETEESANPSIQRISLNSYQLHMRPYTVIRDLLAVVNEGVSTFSELDHRSVLKIFESNAKPNRIRVTEVLGDAVSDARRAKGLTQNELAEIVSGLNPDVPINGLLISRIENKRLKRIEIGLLIMLEQCLELPEGCLINLAKDHSQTAVKAVAAERADIEKAEKTAERVETVATEELAGETPIIRFCAYCGNAFPTQEGRFCPYCGKPKTQI